LHTNIGLPGLVEDLEGEMLDIGLHLGVIVLAADKTFGVEYAGMDGWMS
jgi:hypothetical protein